MGQAFQRQTGYNTKHDQYKCHGVRVLHWLANLGYKCLVADMSVRVKGSLLEYQGLPPKERMSLEEATAWFINIGERNLVAKLFCRLLPERSKQHLDLPGHFRKELGPSLLCPEAWPGAT